MKLCITAGNYHIFKLMIKNHKDSRIQLKNIHPLDFDLVFDVYTSLDQKKMCIRDSDKCARIVL